MSGVRKLLAKAKVAATTSRERLGKLIPHSSSNLDEPEPPMDRRIARLDTKFFATPDRAIAADKTCGVKAVDALGYTWSDWECRRHQDCLSHPAGQPVKHQLSRPPPNRAQRAAASSDMTHAHRKKRCGPIAGPHPVTVAAQVWAHQAGASGSGAGAIRALRRVRRHRRAGAACRIHAAAEISALSRCSVKAHRMMQAARRPVGTDECGRAIKLFHLNAQTFASAVSEASGRPHWGAGRNLVLQRGEATMARISVTRMPAPSRGLKRSKAKRELVG